MMWLKKIFKPKIELPLWFFYFSRTIDKQIEPKEFEASLKRIAHSLRDGQNVILKLNGQPAVISNKSGEVVIKMLQRKDWTLKL